MDKILKSSRNNLQILLHTKEFCTYLFHHNLAEKDVCTRVDQFVYSHLCSQHSDIEQMLELSDIAHEAWHPPIIATIGNTGEGVTEMWDAVLEHRAVIETSGVLKARREFRLRAELREIVARRLELKAREILSGDQWDGLQEQVLNHLLDPWSAADEMLRGVGA